MSVPSVFTDVRTKLSRILLVFQCPVLGRVFRRGSAGFDGGYILGDSGARDQGMYSCGWSGTRGELRGLWIRYSARIDHAITRVRGSLRIFQLAIEAIRRVTQPNRATDKQSALDDQRIDGTRLQGEVGLDMATYMEPQDSAWKVAWQVTENLIKLMHAEVENREKVFMAITVSSGPQVGPDQAARRVLERRLGVADLFYSENRIRALGENSFEVLALAPPFQAYAEEHRIFLHGFPNSGLGQGHWNIAGHHLAGQLIAQELCRTHRLPCLYRRGPRLITSRARPA